MKNKNLNLMEAALTGRASALASLYENKTTDQGVAVFRSATEGDLKRLQNVCESHWSASSWAGLKVVAIYGALLGIALSSLFTEFPTPASDGYLTFVLIVKGFFGAAGALALTVLTSILRAVIKLDALPRLDEALLPLREYYEGCTDALTLMDDSTDAAAHRDAVLQTGRELRGVDLYIMQALARNQAQATREEACDLACKRLHGFAPEPVTTA